jgi:predicted RNase H-like HicB family nuclease
MMEIPIVIHKDKDSVYGVTVPDIPGCFSWGDTVEDAIRNTRQAILGHIEALLSEGMAVDISPSHIETLNVNKDYADAYLWALVDVDISKLDSKPERINISIPRFVLTKLDAFAASRHESRSGVLARAALSLIKAETKATDTESG